MRTYDVIYRERGNKQGYEFCTTVNSKTKKEAREKIILFVPLCAEHISDDELRRAI